MNTSTLGVLGGMGPMASACFYQLVIDNTDAKTDQDHINMVIYSHAHIPDRTTAILRNDSTEVLNVLQKDIDKLIDFGAKYIIMTCNTAHYFIPNLKLNNETILVNMIQETIDFLRLNKAKKVGLLATDGTIATQIYTKCLDDYSIEMVIPSKNKQKMVMDIIYNHIKTGKKVNESHFQEVVSELISQDVDAIVLGCTELSYYGTIKKLQYPFVNPQEIVAKKCITLCGGKLKENV